MVNKKKVMIRDINPKSISTQELYGYVNMSTREWKVGRCSTTRKEYFEQVQGLVSTSTRQYILLRGVISLVKVLPLVYCTICCPVYQSSALIK